MYSNKRYNKKSYSKGKGKLEYKKYRVRGHIKSFRDLEIYKKTNSLASQIFQLELPKNLKVRKKITKELETAYNIAKQVPKLIAESYGDKFTDHKLAYDKLEKAMQAVSNLVTKLDFLTDVIDHADTKKVFQRLIDKYQLQRRKILNLKRAWIRVREKFEGKDNDAG